MPWASCCLLPSKYIQRYHYNNYILLLKRWWNIGKSIHPFRWIRAFILNLKCIPKIILKIIIHNARSNRIKIFSESVCWLVDSFVSWSLICQSVNQSINHSTKQRKSLSWVKIGNAFSLLEEWKLLPWLLLELLSSYESITQRRGKVCCLMFSHLYLATKKSHIKQKKVSTLHSFPTLLQNHDSEASLNNFVLMHFLGDQLLQNLMKDSIFSWKDCARFWWP